MRGESYVRRGAKRIPIGLNAVDSGCKHGVSLVNSMGDSVARAHGRNRIQGSHQTMRSLLVVLAAIAATVVAGGPAAAESYRKAPDANRASALRLDAAQANTGHATKVYVVQMAAKPAVTYQGGLAGFSKTAPAKGERYNSRSPAVQSVLGSPHRAARRAAAQGRRQRPQALQLHPCPERLCRQADAFAGGAAPEGQDRDARLGGSGPEARNEQLPEIPRAAERRPRACAAVMACAARASSSA